MADGEQKVRLHIYDLSQGLARQMSMALLGKQIDAVYHTAIVLGATEHYYGQGLQSAPAGRTPFGSPMQVLDLGVTQLPSDVIQDFLQEQRSVFTPAAYSLFDNNCNNFSDTFANFLTGSGIPGYITALPREVLATPFGQMIAPMLTQTVGQTLGQVHQPAPGAPAGAQPSAAAAATPSGASAGPTGASTRPRGVSTHPVGIPSLSAGRGASASSAQPKGSSSSPATDTTAAEIKQALAFTTADTGVPMEAGTSHTAGTPGNTGESQGFRDLAQTSAQLHRDSATAVSLGRVSSGPQSEPLSSGVPSVPNTGSGPNQSAAAAVAQGAVGQGDLQERVKQEFQRLMAQGNLSADEAGVQALQAAMRPA